MPLLARLSSLWRNLFRKSQAEQELKEEVDAYLEMLIEMKIEQGIHPAEARRQALIEMGGVEVGRSFDLALPICANALVRGNNRRLDSAGMWWLTVTGRLKPGWSLEQAAAQMQAVSPGLFETTLPANYQPASVKDYLGSKLIAVPAGTGVSQ